MRCEHGKEVTAILSKYFPPWWDDGVLLYDKDGEKDDNGKFLRVGGCEQCKLIHVREDEAD